MKDLNELKAQDGLRWISHSKVKPKDDKLQRPKCSRGRGRTASADGAENWLVGTNALDGHVHDMMANSEDEDCLYGVLIVELLTRSFSCACLRIARALANSWSGRMLLSFIELIPCVHHVHDCSHVTTIYPRNPACLDRRIPGTASP